MAQAENVASERPAICERIRVTRKKLKDEWRAAHPAERPNPYSQEQIASKLGVTLGAYGPYERYREPSLPRLRQIAVALGLDEDYFSPTGDLASTTARLEAEADRLHELGNQLETWLQGLRTQPGEGESSRPPDEQKR